MGAAPLRSFRRVRIREWLRHVYNAAPCSSFGAILCVGTTVAEISFFQGAPCQNINPGASTQMRGKRECKTIDFDFPGGHGARIFRPALWASRFDFPVEAPAFMRGERVPSGRAMKTRNNNCGFSRGFFPSTFAQIATRASNTPRLKPQYRDCISNARLESLAPPA